MKTNLIKSLYQDDPEFVAILECRGTPAERIFVKGDKGEPGYAPSKGVDYFDGRDGKDGRDGRDGKNGRNGARGERGAAGTDGKDGTHGLSPIVDEEKLIERLIEKVIKEQLLDISNIRNASTFMKDGIKYKIEELMHGGSAGTTTTNIVTQYSLVATQSGSDAVVALSQLTHFATLGNVVAAYRNQIPQTNGVTMTVTATSITFLNADAGEVFSVSYVYTS